MAILGVLASVVVVALRGASADSRDAACKTDYVEIEKALETYATQELDGRQTLTAMATADERMTALVDAGLLRRGSSMYTITTFDDIDPIAGGSCVGQFDPSA